VFDDCSTKTEFFGTSEFHRSEIMIEYGEFKGNKMLIIKRDENDKFPFQFGKTKAKMIVDNFEAIKQFAEEE